MLLLMLALMLGNAPVDAEARGATYGDAVSTGCAWMVPPPMLL